jgi:hypothetical protein
MRLVVLAPVLVWVLTGVACGSSPPQPKGPPEGATAGQPADTKATRPLSHEECAQLGQSIIDTCHGTNTRIATIEGWCSTVITGVGEGNWISDCEKHIKQIDAVCFASTDSVRAMMDCDSAVAR